MTQKTSYKPGEFCWVDLLTSDPKSAEKFYVSLFGWTTNPIPMAPGAPPYVMLLKNGKDVSAMMEDKTTPPHWAPYVFVANIDDAAKEAETLGATILAEPFDVTDAGRMAVIQDPQGAALNLWQGKRHIGAGVTGEPGTMCWNELYTPDIEGSRKFYTALFGWKLKISPEYTEAHVGETATGGMMQMRPEMKGMPPNWMPYFAVDDVDSVVKKAEAGGGRVHNGPMDIPDTGRFAVMGDPQGASFAVIKLKQR